jgi:dCTP deaminase
MSIKSDKWIRENSLLRDMIVPFVMDNENKIVVHGEEKKVPSFGLSSYGYDVRLGPNFKFFRGQEAYLVRSSPNSGGGLSVNTPVLASTLGRSIDIADFANTCELASFEDLAWIELPAKSFCLGHTIEKVTVPRDVSVVCMGKSTVARAGIIVTVTPLESAFIGSVTLEITNTTDLPVRIYPGMGITQLQFFQSDEQCLVSYADRNGKYQNQPAEPVPPM